MTTKTATIDDLQTGPVGHRLSARHGTDTALLTGLCECGWESARYGLKATVKRAHAVHLDQQIEGREATHEELVSEFFHNMVFGGRS